MRKYDKSGSLYFSHCTDKEVLFNKKEEGGWREEKEVRKEREKEGRGGGKGGKVRGRKENREGKRKENEKA